MQQAHLGEGYTSLLTILVVTSVIGMYIINLLSITLNNSQGINNFYSGNQAYYLNQSCLEEALFTIRNNNLFSGSNSLNIYNGTCTYTVILGIGENRTINILSSFNNSTKRLKATVININPVINVTSVSEVDSF